MAHNRASWVDITIVLTHVIIAAMAVFAYFSAFERYDQSVKNQKILVAIEASKRWESAVTELSLPAYSFAKNNGDKDIMEKLKRGAQIMLCPKADWVPVAGRSGGSCIEQHKSRPYGFLIAPSGAIPAEKVNDLRMALTKFLNALEHIAILNSTGQADRETLEKSYLGAESVVDYYDSLESFIDLYQPDSWEEFKKLVREKREELSK